MASEPGNDWVAAGRRARYGRRLVRPAVPRWVERRARRAAGEDEVGVILDALAPAGWLTVHDAFGGRRSVGHITVGPAGVFAIGAGSRRDRVAASSRSRSRSLARAQAGRVALERLTGLRMECVLVLRGDQGEGLPVSRQRGVLVLSVQALGSHLAGRTPALTREQVIERYARTVSALSAL